MPAAHTEFGNRIRSGRPAGGHGISRVSVVVAGRPEPYELLPLAGEILGMVQDRPSPSIAVEEIQG